MPAAAKDSVRDLGPEPLQNLWRHPTNFFILHHPQDLQQPTRYSAPTLTVNKRFEVRGRWFKQNL